MLVQLQEYPQTVRSCYQAPQSARKMGRKVTHSPPNSLLPRTLSLSFAPIDMERSGSSIGAAGSMNQNDVSRCGWVETMEVLDACLALIWDLCGYSLLAFSTLLCPCVFTRSFVCHCFPSCGIRGGGPMTMFMNVSLHFGPEGGQCRGLNACLSLSPFMVTRECGQRWDFQ